MPLDRIYQYIPTPFGIHRIGYVPVHYLSAIYVDDGKHIHETFKHGDVSDIRLPYLSRPFDLKVPEQVRKFIVCLVCFAQILFRMYGFQIHELIQPTNPLLRSEERRVGKVLDSGVWRNITEQ